LKSIVDGIIPMRASCSNSVGDTVAEPPD
jgi:hypothetical protein